MLSAYPKTVKLKDGAAAIIRPLDRDDFEKLLAFFQELPDEDRIFLRHDVRDPGLIRKWTASLNLDRVIPLVACDGDALVANGSLHIMPNECMKHVGHIRLVTARSHRHRGLGGLMTRELVSLAQARDLEKLQAHVIEDNIGAVNMFTAVGFKKEAVLTGMIKDRNWKSHNLAVMVNDVANLGKIIEDWIQESMLPGFRAPGGGL
ncbi:MAG: GNAT family N-acetyltransferase [Planctomycetota bacterium]